MNLHQNLYHGTCSLFPSKSFKHSAIFSLGIEHVTPSSTHDFTSMDRELLNKVYGPLYSRLKTALELFSSDPSASLAEFNKIKTELESAL